jgi:uncharacterized protein
MAPPKTDGGIRWRGWNRVVHRSLGYLCAGLTIVYAVSGLAVNHIDGWNPNYIVRSDTVRLGPVTEDIALSQPFISDILAQLGLEGPVRGTYRSAPDRLDIFAEAGTVTVDLTNGVASFRDVRDRPVLRSLNFLHLNEAKRLWTVVADVFAAALLLLAVTGLFMVKGRQGVLGRGAWYVAAGVLIPVVVLLMYR